MTELILQLKGRPLKRYEVAQVTTTIGRHPENDVFIDNPGVSRDHAAVVFEDPEFVVLDRDSANGVFVNGVRTTMHRLKDGDRIEIGKFELVFHRPDGDAHPLAGPIQLGEHKADDPARTVRLSAVSPADLDD